MESVNSPTMFDLFRRIAAAERELWKRFGLNDQGQYAARLVAETIGAQVLANGVNKGFDLVHPTYGRIEVRSRRYPLDGRAQLPKVKEGLFDYFSHVLLDQDFNVIGAYLAPHDAIDRLASASSHRYVCYGDGKALPGAVDITVAMQRVQAGVGQTV